MGGNISNNNSKKVNKSRIHAKIDQKAFATGLGSGSYEAAMKGAVVTKDKKAKEKKIISSDLTNVDADPAHRARAADGAVVEKAAEGVKKDPEEDVLETENEEVDLDRVIEEDEYLPVVPTGIINLPSEGDGVVEDQHLDDDENTFLPAIRDEFDVEVYKDRAGERLDPLTLYLREINKYKLLSTEQERALTKALAESGDIEVAKKLVQANLRLVVKIAMEYRHAYHNLMDLIQEGNIGLMKAVSKFDPTKGAKLSYYASWWIRSYILKFILDNFRLVKIGTTSEQKKLFYNLLREKERLVNMGIAPETKLISHNLGVSEKAVTVMDYRLSSQGSELSIDRPTFDDQGRQSTLADSISSGDTAIDEALAESQGLSILKEHLHDFMSSLKERDRIIFEKRLLSEVPPSLQSIADEYGVSRERIRQVEERLLKKLKVYMSEFIR